MFVDEADPEVELEERGWSRYDVANELIERIPIHEKITLAADLMLRREIQQDIMKTLRAYKLVFELPPTFYWGWMIEHAEDGYSGTLPKRLSKACYNAIHQWIPTQLQGDIGELARRHLPDSKEWIFDFDDEIDWKDGDFGDVGSCLLKGGETDSRKQLRAMSTMAMRRWNGDAGVGRCWVMPVEHGLMLFNRYDNSEYVRLADYALPLARFLQADFAITRITWDNKRTIPYHLYVNGNEHYLIGKGEDIRKYAGVMYTIPLVSITG